MFRFSSTLLCAALTGCSLSNLGMPSPAGGDHEPADTGVVDTGSDTGDSGIDTGVVDTAVEDTGDSGIDSGVIDTGSGDTAVEECDVEPYCDGNVVYYCVGDVLESFDCASASLECGTDAGYASCQEVKVISTDADGDGYASDVDCDDSNAAVNSAATEVSNGVDDDCDGSVDENALSCDNIVYDAPSSWGSSVSTDCTSAPSPFAGFVVNADDGANWAFENGYSSGVRCSASTGAWYKDTDGDGDGDERIYPEPVSWEAWTEADPVAATEAAAPVVSGGCDGYIE